jgi:hypothetical protein
LTPAASARPSAPDADHLDPVAAVQPVEDRLQVGAVPGGEDDDAEGAHRRIFAQCLRRVDR